MKGQKNVTPHARNLERLKLNFLNISTNNMKKNIADLILEETLVIYEILIFIS